VEGLVFAAHKLEFPEPSPSDGQTTWVKQNQWKQFSVQAKK
jgi:hypothetical protein